jgi:hypothetical protein
LIHVQLDAPVVGWFARNQVRQNASKWMEAEILSNCLSMGRMDRWWRGRWSWVIRHGELIVCLEPIFGTKKASSEIDEALMFGALLDLGKKLEGKKINKECWSLPSAPQLNLFNRNFFTLIFYAKNESRH